MSGKKIIRGLKEAVEFVGGGSEADRLDRAAQMALDDGDMDHWRQLCKRADAARRRAREAAAGVRNPWSEAR